MSRESERFVDPITNAARPGTLAALSMTILKFSENDPVELILLHFFLYSLSYEEGAVDRYCFDVLVGVSLRNNILSNPTAVNPLKD
jgi:hypothetical protein